jgi:hypothetical protein
MFVGRVIGVGCGTGGATSGCGTAAINRRAGWRPLAPGCSPYRRRQSRYPALWPRTRAGHSINSSTPANTGRSLGWIGRERRSVRCPGGADLSGEFDQAHAGRERIAAAGTVRTPFSR